MFNGCSHSYYDGTVYSVFTYYNIHPISNYPLFNADNSINKDVMSSLLLILNDPHFNPSLRREKTTWPTGLPYDGITYIATTAADFSNFVVPNPTNMNYAGAVVIKLFEEIPHQSGVKYGYVTEFTSQWWQLVYRSTDNEKDVLTLWMMQPYRLTYFNGTRYDSRIERLDERFICVQERVQWSDIPNNSINTIKSDERIAQNLPACNSYFFEGNYSNSIARSNLLRDMAMVLNNFNIEQFLIAPNDIPGRWQSSRYQTGSNGYMRFYSSGNFQRDFSKFQIYMGSESGSLYYTDGLGAAGLIWGWHSYYLFSLNNGKDGLSVGPYNSNWLHTQNFPTHYDLLWLPSDFEVRSMGHNKEVAMFQTFIADPNNSSSELRWNYEIRENDPRHDLSKGRSGLWQLNGFDRAFYVDSYLSDDWVNNLVWLRSADIIAIGNANTIYHTGNRYGHGVNQMAGMRPALHLSITKLLQYMRYWAAHDTF